MSDKSLFEVVKELVALYDELGCRDLVMPDAIRRAINVLRPYVFIENVVQNRANYARVVPFPTARQLVLPLKESANEPERTPAVPRDTG